MLAALFIAECFPGPWSAFHGISQEKATGLAAVAGGLVESALSPSFWLVAILLFALFLLDRTTGQHGVENMLVLDSSGYRFSILCGQRDNLDFSFPSLPSRFEELTDQPSFGPTDGPPFYILCG